MVHELLATPLPFVFDAETGVVAIGESRAQLPPVEARLLAALIEARGAPVSAPAVVQRVWGYEFDTAAADLLRTHVYQLRRRLAEAGLPPLVETLPRRGYRLAGLDD